jgi:uncharacterized repeat protein (TIGR03843 family)
VRSVLESGDIDVHGRIAGSSNATLLVTCSFRGRELLAVYKPARGERPLWDFPRGLHRREVAAYRLSELLGWDLVPETVERADGPFGAGSLQRFVPTDGTSHYFTLVDDPQWHDALRRIAAFDVIANNADRKSGHVLLADGRIWAIDHGLCFHSLPKLRTVVWDFAGEPLLPRIRDDLRLLIANDGRALADAFHGLLDREERAALHDRVAALVGTGHLPSPDAEGDWPPYPWPLV